jgi:hypothetical protein
MGRKRTHWSIDRERIETASCKAKYASSLTLQVGCAPSLQAHERERDRQTERERVVQRNGVSADMR